MKIAIESLFAVSKSGHFLITLISVGGQIEFSFPKQASISVRCSQ